MGRMREPTEPPVRLDAVALGMRTVDQRTTFRRSIEISMAVWPTPYGAGRHWGLVTALFIDVVMPWMRRLAGITRDRAHGLRRSATAWVAVRRATSRTAQHRRWSVAPVVGVVAHSSGAQTVVGVGIGMAVAAVFVHAYAAPGPAVRGPAAPAPRLEVALAPQGSPVSIADARDQRPTTESTAPIPTTGVASPETSAPTRAPSQRSEAAPRPTAAPSSTRGSGLTAVAVPKPPRDPRGERTDRGAGKKERPDRSQKHDRSPKSPKPPKRGH